jgi:hypothetical protein
MNLDRIERAVALGRKLEHFFIALVGSDGFPYVTSVREIERVAENQLAIEEWICNATVTHIAENAKIAVLIWDPATGDGYEVFGNVQMFESRAFMNGFAPEAETRTSLNKVKRRLVIKAERTIAFSQVLNCDDIPSFGMSSRLSSVPARDDIGAEVSFCGFEPEWAEHAGFSRVDAPCGDGRDKLVREGEDSIPVR